MNDKILYARNQMVIKNVHIFKKYFKNIGELAFESDARISEREVAREERKALRTGGTVEFSN